MLELKVYWRYKHTSNGLHEGCKEERLNLLHTFSLQHVSETIIIMVIIDTLLNLEGA